MLEMWGVKHHTKLLWLAISIMHLVRPPFLIVNNGCHLFIWTTASNCTRVCMHSLMLTLYQL